jgi:hypothetical protein
MWVYNLDLCLKTQTASSGDRGFSQVTPRCFPELHARHKWWTFPSLLVYQKLNSCQLGSMHPIMPVQNPSQIFTSQQTWFVLKLTNKYMTIQFH